MRTDKSDPASNLTREQILAALAALSDGLREQDAIGEICLFGGTVMVLAFSARVSTKDVDALFQPTQCIRDLALRVARKLNLPSDWLNDGVKGFVSSRHETTTGNLPQFPNLRLTMPVPEYLLAMKSHGIASWWDCRRAFGPRRHHVSHSPSKAWFPEGSAGLGGAILRSAAHPDPRAASGGRII